MAHATDAHPAAELAIAEIAPQPAPRRAVSPRLLLLGIFLAAIGLYVVLALAVALPLVIPDEQRYSQLARSLVAGHGFVWRGEGQAQAIDQTAALYVYFIAPIWWLFDSAVHARDASKILGTLALCSQVLPVWLLARRVLDERLALIPAVLAVAGTWMLTGAFTVTEALALPLSTAALCATAMALQRPGSRAGYVAILFALLATWARLQLVVLIPVLFLAFALDVLRVPARRRDRLRAHRPFLLITAAMIGALVLVWRAAPGAAGDASGVLGAGLPAAGLVLRKSGLQLLELVVLSGFVPVLLAAAAGLSPRLWREDRTGPLLVVFWLAALATAVQSGAYFTVDTDIQTGVERYVFYAAPIALVLAIVVLDQRRLPRWTFPIAALLALLLLAMPPHQIVIIEAAVWATAYRVHALTGLGRPEALAAAAVAVVLATWIVTRRTTGARRALAGAAVVLAALAVQDVTTWNQAISSSRALRGLFPDDLAWIDHHAGGPVALLGAGDNVPQILFLDYYSRTLTQSFVPSDAAVSGAGPQGQACPYAVDRGGMLTFSSACGTIPHRLLLADRLTRMRFYGETGSAHDAMAGRIVQVEPSHPPRLQSRFTLPCPAPLLPAFSSQDDARTIPASAPRGCEPAVRMSFWLDHPAKVTLVFRGGARDQHATLGSARYLIRAKRDTTIAGDLPKGDSQVVLNLDWATSMGPRVVKAQMRTGGRTVSLIY